MNIALIGYGKMGREVEEIAKKRDHLIIEIIQSVQELNNITAKNIDVVIEFTEPKSAVNNILFCIEHQLPIVCGTTGWNKHLPQVEDAVNKYKGTLLYSSNFSIGMNVFFEVNRKLAQLMNAQKNYIVNISEIHHVHKLDSPSGTAITLANDIMKYHSRYDDWTTKENESKENELPIYSKREGNVPGTHNIEYSSPEDSIKIEHKAHNRNGFALGAILAAEFLYDKKGIFTMKDVINFSN